MQTSISIISGVALLALAGWLLVRSHRRPGSSARSLGFGALFTPFLLWFGFGRYLQVTWWQVPLLTAVAFAIVSVLIHLLRLPRKLSNPQSEGDLLDLLVDRLLDRLTK
ncbi:MAG TPA: hypothetical protein VNT01_07405 [Symbiobacteriaceae bacterium]|nr:hypothetical protein [Symbiobacteriaceae bacterium]